MRSASSTRKAPSRRSRPTRPRQDALEKAVAGFRKPGGDDADDRELLLEAFAAQSAVDWPGLESLLVPAEG